MKTINPPLLVRASLLGFSVVSGILALSLLLCVSVSPCCVSPDPDFSTERSSPPSPPSEAFTSSLRASPPPVFPSFSAPDSSPSSGSSRGLGLGVSPEPCSELGLECREREGSSGSPRRSTCGRRPAGSWMKPTNMMPWSAASWICWEERYEHRVRLYLLASLDLHEFPCWSGLSCLNNNIVYCSWQ